MSQLLDRINQLAAKARTEGLTPEETNERDELRKEYLAAVRRNIDAQLESVQIVETDGTKHKLKKKNIH